jgi:hypothetical protein
MVKDSETKCMNKSDKNEDSEYKTATWFWQECLDKYVLAVQWDVTHILQVVNDESLLTSVSED